MRLAFLGQEHEAVTLQPGVFRLGAANECEISIPHDGWAAHQATLSFDMQRGLWLKLEPHSGYAYVNARPVRECAMLRAGDMVSIGGVQFLIVDDPHAESQTIPAPLKSSVKRELASSSRAVVRGVVGLFHGRTFSLASDLLIGSSADADIRISGRGIAERHARLELHRDVIVLRAEVANSNVFVNGVQVDQCILHSGDQLVIDPHRFVIEAPGLLTRGAKQALNRQSPITQILPSVNCAPSEANVSDISEQKRSEGFNVWWLLVASVGIAAILVAILIYAPR